MIVKVIQGDYRKLGYCDLHKQQFNYKVLYHFIYWQNPYILGQCVPMVTVSKNFLAQNIHYSLFNSHLFFACFPKKAVLTLLV